MKKLLIALPLLIIAFILGRCAGDLTGEAGPAGSDALSSPTLTIRGGGKISWAPDTENTDNFKVNFTEDIIIYDHQAGSTITITPSASPVTLADPDDVGYVARVTAAGSETTLTRIDVAALDTVSAGDSSETALVLFHRTDEDTLWLPWIQKELLTGDFWQFGAALSWYERLTTSRKPGYTNDGTEDHHVTVPASLNSPAVVSIAGKLYANTSDKVCDLSSNDRGGLDSTSSLTGGKVYYLYGIPAANGRTFDLVTSDNDPETGPDGYTSWSYIGGFATDATSTIFKLTASNGTCRYGYNGHLSWSTNSETPAKKTLYIPVTAKSVMGRMSLQNGTIGVRGVVTPTDSGSDGWTFPQTISTGDDARLYVESPIFTPRSIWLYTSDSDRYVYFELMGFVEDPMAYK